MDPQLELTRNELVNTVNILREVRFTAEQAVACGYASSTIGKMLAQIEVLTNAAAPALTLAENEDNGNERSTDPDHQ